MERKQAQTANDSPPETQPRRYSALIVEDDQITRDVLLACLQESGLEAVAVSSLKAARHEVKWACPDLVVLDLGLPDGDGVALAHELRAAHPTVGILVVSALTRTMDLLLGLEAGADDYVRKPFIPSEVVARALAILRRLHGSVPGLSQSGAQLGQWRLDIEGHRLIGEDDMVCDLTRAECALLTHLLRSRGRIQSRERLLSAIGSQSSAATDRTVDVLIGRLRRKLDDNGFTQPEMIQTVRGVGYCLRNAAEAELSRRPPDKTPPHSADELLHEFQVHQIEREMQNEALRQTQLALEESHHSLRENQQRLHEAWEQTRAAHLAKDRLLGTIGHELRTSLSDLLGLMRLLADSPLTAQQRQWVETMHSTVQAQWARLSSPFETSPRQVKEPLPVPISHDHSPPSPNLRILLIEDDWISRTVASDLLASLGHDVVVAENGIRALETCAERYFDLILTDLHMPGMDGFEFVSALRQRPERLNTLVFALTANSSVDIRHQATAAFDAVLTKPFDEQDLYRVLGTKIPGFGHFDPPLPPQGVSAAVNRLDRNHLTKNLATLDPKSRGDWLRLAREALTTSGTNIRHSAELGDWLTLAREAHRLVSSASTAGLFDLQNQAVELEDSAYQDGQNIAPRLAKLEVLLLQALHWLEDMGREIILDDQQSVEPKRPPS